jgi:Tfp pilus assembly protein PilN
MKPRPLELDYIASPRRPVWLGVAILAAALALGGVLFEQYRDTQVELSRLETEAGMLGSDRRPARAVPKERLDEEVKAAEVVVRSLTLPWASLVETLEKASTRDVALLQLQPDAQNRLVRLTLEARSRQAMFDYMRRLGASQTLADAHILSHQVQIEDPQKPIQFSVQATMREAR